jgi:hypothetical protein
MEVSLCLNVLLLGLLRINFLLDVMGNTLGSSLLYKYIIVMCLALKPSLWQLDFQVVCA